jgi:hypothetical protein
MSTPAHDRKSGWPAALRRSPMEMAATIVIGAGVVMLMQPFWFALYSYSLVTTLFGTVMYMIVSKFPE